MSRRRRQIPCFPAILLNISLGRGTVQAEAETPDLEEGWAVAAV